MRFKPFTAGSWFTIGVAALIVIVALIVGIVTHTLQSIVACTLAAAAAGYIGWRYIQAKLRLAKEFTAYGAPWDANVFAADEKARERWSFGVSSNIWRAFRDVCERMGMPYATLEGLTIRVVSEPFEVPGLPGLNRGVTYPDTGTIVVAWLSDEASPYAVLCHELSHIAIGRTQNLWGQEEAHAYMRLKGYPW